MLSLIEATLRPHLAFPTLSGTPRLHLMDRPYGPGMSGKDLDKALVLSTLKFKGRRTVTQLIDDIRRADAAVRTAVKTLLDEKKIDVVATRGKARFYELVAGVEAELPANHDKEDM